MHVYDLRGNGRSLACACKVLVYLFVQILPVGHDNERKIAGNFSKHFLGEEYHGVAFPAALGVPEDTEAPAVIFELLQCLSSIIHTVFQTLVRCLKFDEDQRQTVDKADKVSAALVHLTRNPDFSLPGTKLSRRS